MTGPTKPRAEALSPAEAAAVRRARARLLDEGPPRPVLAGPDDLEVLFSRGDVGVPPRFAVLATALAVLAAGALAAPSLGIDVSDALMSAGSAFAGRP